MTASSQTDAKTKDLVLAWLAGSDTGSSSKTLAFEAAGIHDARAEHPYDPSDLGRCIRLIAKVPEARLAVDTLAKRSRYWKALAPIWDDLVSTYEEELPTGKCPKTYAKMRAARHLVEDSDPNVTRLGPGVIVRRHP